jgi:putative Ca2+/H+ antiporter (TMEM165/GDT1 family)
MARLLKISLAVFLVSSFSLINFVASEESEDENIQLVDELAKKSKAAEELAEKGSKLSDDRFLHGFLASLSVIIVSELGDKTFFIAAIMAMKHSRLTVFSGAIIALALMHVMASFFGYMTTIIPRVITYYASSLLFAIFGLKMLHEGYHMSPHEGQEEYEEVNEELRKREEVEGRGGSLEQGLSGKKKEPSVISFVGKIFVQAFTMTFLAEWGDRSQIATVILAAREDVYGVCVGGVLGHALCTGLAVVGGRMIATKISVRTVTIAGGVVFILFALSALLISPE